MESSVENGKCATCEHPASQHGAPFSTDATCQVEGCECFGFDALSGTPSDVKPWCPSCQDLNPECLACAGHGHERARLRCRHSWTMRRVEGISPDQQCGHGCGTTYAQSRVEDEAVDCRWPDGCRLAGVCSSEGVCHGKLVIPAQPAVKPMSQRVDECLTFLEQFNDASGKVNCTRMRNEFERLRRIETAVRNHGPCLPGCHICEALRPL